jgi:CBS domain containing-hemolysin-like protein
VIAFRDGYEIQVLDADPRRIKRVRIRPSTPPPPSAD